MLKFTEYAKDKISKNLDYIFTDLNVNIEIKGISGNAALVEVSLSEKGKTVLFFEPRYICINDVFTITGLTVSLKGIGTILFTGE